MGLAAIAAAAQAAEAVAASAAADAAEARPSPPMPIAPGPPISSSHAATPTTPTPVGGASSSSSPAITGACTPSPIASNTSAKRPPSTSSDTTGADTDAFESDSSLHLSPGSGVAATPGAPPQSTSVAAAAAAAAAAVVSVSTDLGCSSVGINKRRGMETAAPPSKMRKATSCSPKTSATTTAAVGNNVVLSKNGNADVGDVFPASVLLDLAGSTSAEVRRMNEDERALVHYKRRLRNRESAKRSRARRQATIGDIQSELEDLRSLTAGLVDRCMGFARMSERQAQEIETLRKEKQLLESLLRSSGDAVL